MAPMNKGKMRSRTIIIAIIGVVGFLFISNIFTKREQQEAFEKWSVIVAQNFKKMQSGEENSIYAKGKHTKIPQLEYDQMVAYYKLSKLSEEEAKKEADAYVKQRYAIYVKAIENGYDVTEQQINAYIEELKKDMGKEENKKTVAIIKKAFGSEELYWEYEKELCKIDLPVRNYINELAKEYEKSHEKVTEKEWNNKFKTMKEQFVKEEQFEIVGKNS